MDTQKRSEINFYWLLLQVLAGHAPTADLVSHPLFLDRGQRICNCLARGTSYGPEDLFQDVCLKLLKSGAKLCPDNIPSEDAFFRWLLVIALNLRRDDFRKNGKFRRQEVSLGDALSEALSVVDRGVGPEGDCLLGEFDAFTETLPEKTRLAIALRRQGLTYDKIAVALSRVDDKGVTNVTVRKWVVDGLKAFFDGRGGAPARKAARRAV